MKMGEVAYYLDILEEAHIHNTFHVSLLKKRVGKDNITEQKLLGFYSKHQTMPEPVKILYRRS
jgi:hypothetical protein